MSGNNININDLKDVALQRIARSHDTKKKNGVLEGDEIFSFNNEIKEQNIVTNINNLQDLKNPQKLLTNKNIITVVENYSKNNKNTTLFGALIKETTIDRKERKRILLETFNIFYDAIFATTKTQSQKEELELLKNQFLNSVNEELDESWFESTISNSNINEIVNTILKYHSASSEELAGGIFDYIDNTNFSFGDTELSYLLDSIDSGNVISVAQKIKEHPANTDKESLLRILAQEYTFPFDNDEANDKKKRINTFVTQFFKATNYSESPYMDEAKKLVTSIINSFDTTSNILTGDIDLLDSLMDSILMTKPDDIANKLHTLLDENSYAVDRPDVRVLLDKINVSNVNEILKTFKSIGDKKSLLAMLDDEWNNEYKSEDYIKKIVLTQLDLSGRAQNANIKNTVLNSLEHENIEDVEALMKTILDKKQSPKTLANTLFNQLDDDEDNVNKEVVKYILNSINKDNVTNILKEFNILSNNKPLTAYLQKNSEESSINYVKQIANALIDANEKILDTEAFNSTFKLDKKTLQQYVAYNTQDIDDMSNFINAFLPTTAIMIAKTIKNIASDKQGAINDVTFKLWISKITPENVLSVIEEYKNQNNNETPINAIIEERNSNANMRQALILHILSAVITKIGEKNIDNTLIEKFTSNLEKELFSWGMASASELNAQLNQIIGNFESNEVSKTIVNRKVAFDPNNLKLTNVRANVPELSFGEKYGKYSWQYEKLKNIKTIEDVAKFTGLRVEFLEEMIEFEGYRKEKYKCSSDKLTIGIGHNFDSIKGPEKDYLYNQTLTDKEIYQIFTYDLVNTIHELIKNKKIETIHLTPGEYEALVDVCFNAPNHMKNLTEGTKLGIKYRKQNNLQDAASVLEQNTFEFNQQYSNGSIVAGLCKRRMHNVLRFMDVDTYSELEQYPNARNRIIFLLKNGAQASPIYKSFEYKNDVCKILGITSDEFNTLLNKEIKEN